MIEEAPAQPIENSKFLNVVGKREDSYDELDILFVDDEGEPKTENRYVFDVEKILVFLFASLLVCKSNGVKRVFSSVVSKPNFR